MKRFLFALVATLATVSTALADNYFARCHVDLPYKKFGRHSPFHNFISVKPEMLEMGNTVMCTTASAALSFKSGIMMGLNEERAVRRVNRANTDGRYCFFSNDQSMMFIAKSVRGLEDLTPIEIHMLLDRRGNCYFTSWDLTGH